MIMDGELSTIDGLNSLANAGASIFAKADPLAKQHRDLPTSAYDAAIREFQNRNGDLSNVDSEDDDLN
jgi:hypothetical protein